MLESQSRLVNNIFNVHKMRNFMRTVKLFRHFSQRTKTSKATEKAMKPDSLFPKTLLSKKHKTPPAFYLTQSSTADDIIKLVEPELGERNTIIEINPGAGFLTKKFIERDDVKKIIGIESNAHFMSNLMNLQSDRVDFRLGDFVSMGKVLYQDKMDSGTRVHEMLKNIPMREHLDDGKAFIFAAIGSYNFFTNLIASVVFQNGLFQHGGCEMFFIISPPIYIHLTCDSEVGYMIYRSSSILFQMFFEYKFLGKLPRSHFLPKQIGYNLKKNFRLARINSIDPEYLYLVKVVQRPNLNELCPIADLQALWYFVKQNCISRRNRIIPNLEKWVPGCGPRLIVNLNESEPSKQLYPYEDISKLPKFSRPCKTLSNKDYFPNINIYTQFGDLSPSQMLTLFCQFRQWKEYLQSPFLASLENSFLKMDPAADEKFDNITDEDYIVEEDTLDDDEDESQKSRKSSRKSKSLSLINPDISDIS